MKNNNNKKLIIPLLALLLLAGIGGTVAWLTSTSTLENEFTVGTFNSPTTDPTDSTKTINIPGNLHEPSWNKDETHKLVPGATFAKDPYVGIGTGSEDAVVYVYVDNHFTDKVQFAINEGWEAIDATEGSNSTTENKTYTKGLFKYTAGLSGATSSDKWTTYPLFSEVVIDDEAEDSDFSIAGDEKKIVVKSFLHQAKDASGDAIDDLTVIRPAARKAFELD